MSDDKKTLTKVLGYVGAIASLILAIIAIVVAVNSDDPDEKLAGIAVGLGEVADSANQAKAVSLEQKDFEVCVASSVASAVASASAESVSGVAGGACVIPSVSVDVSDCVAVKGSATSGVDVPAVVDLSLDPVVGLLRGLISTDGEDQVKAWASGVVDWIYSGKPSIIALIEDPASGVLKLDSVTIDGCSP